MSKAYKDEKKWDDLEKRFWEFYPHETSWAEFRKFSPELYCEIQNIGMALVLLGRIKTRDMND
jgi:hypothetical protein